MVPAFEKFDDAAKEPEMEEQEDQAAVPGSLSDLIECIALGSCRVFQEKDNPDGHSSTDTERWLQGKYYDDGGEKLERRP